MRPKYISGTHSVENNYVVVEKSCLLFDICLLFSACQVFSQFSDRAGGVGGVKLSFATAKVTLVDPHGTRDWTWPWQVNCSVLILLVTQKYANITQQAAIYHHHTI